MDETIIGYPWNSPPTSCWWKCQRFFIDSLSQQLQQPLSRRRQMPVLRETLHSSYVKLLEYPHLTLHGTRIASVSATVDAIFMSSIQSWMGMVSYCVFYLSVLQGIKEITPAGLQIRWALRLQNKLFYKFIEKAEVSQVEVDFNSNNYELGHLHKMFRFPSPDRPIFLKSKRKKNSRITCKEASTLIYKHTILSY